MSSLRLAVLLSFILLPRSQAQLKLPSDLMPAVLSPPSTVAEVLHRCPAESDTLVQRWMLELQQIVHQEKESINRDSLLVRDTRRLPKIREKEALEHKLLQEDLDRYHDSLLVRLRKLTASSSERLLKAIRLIGEELDNDITACPKVGPLQIYDSTCVAAAESNAAKKRLVAVIEYLSFVDSQWKLTVHPLQREFLLWQKRTSKLFDSSRNAQFTLQLKRLALESLHTLMPTLTTIDEITRLSAQFAR